MAPYPPKSSQDKEFIHNNVVYELLVLGAPWRDKEFIHSQEPSIRYPFPFPSIRYPFPYPSIRYRFPSPTPSPRAVYPLPLTNFIFTQFIGRDQRV